MGCGGSTLQSPTSAQAYQVNNQATSQPGAGKHADAPSSKPGSARGGGSPSSVAGGAPAPAPAPASSSSSAPGGGANPAVSTHSSNASALNTSTLTVTVPHSNMGKHAEVIQTIPIAKHSSRSRPNSAMLYPYDVSGNGAEPSASDYFELPFSSEPTFSSYIPPNLHAPLSSELRSHAIRSVDTPTDVFSVVNGSLLVLSSSAETWWKEKVKEEEKHKANASKAKAGATQLPPDDAADSNGILFFNESDPEVAVSEYFAAFQNIYDIWNTPQKIPVLTYTPGQHRESVQTPANKQAGGVATSPSALKASFLSRSETLFGSSLQVPSTLSGATALTTKTEPHPAWLGEHMCIIKLLELDIYKHRDNLAKSKDHAFRKKILQMLKSFEYDLQMMLVRGKFLSSMYSNYDQYHLSLYRRRIESIRCRLNGLSPGGRRDIPPDHVEHDIARRFDEKSKSIEQEAFYANNLQPLDFTNDISLELNRYIQGTRLGVCKAFWQWIHENKAMPSYEDELAEQNDNEPIRPSTAMLLRRVFWLRGSSGVGKTTISALLCEVFHEHILAVHFCKYDVENRKSPIKMIKNLSYQLAQRLPAYAHELQTRLQKLSNITQFLDSLSALDLFDQLLIQPLNAIKQPSTIEKNAKLVILIDGIDESENSSNHDNSILKILCQQVNLLPSWIGIMLTSRPEDRIVRALAKFKPTEISCDSNDNTNDLKKILNHVLTPYIHPNELVEAIDVILKKSEGLMLYVRQVLDAKLPVLKARWEARHDAHAASSGSAGAAASPARASAAQPKDRTPSATPRATVSAPPNSISLYPVTLADIKNFPQGLSNFYLEVFEGFRHFLTRYKQSFTPVLHIIQMILCAFEPMTPNLLAEVLNYKNGNEILRILAPISQLFPYRHYDNTSSRFFIFHKSLKDWLTDDRRLENSKEKQYWIHLKNGHARLAERSWSIIVSQVEGQTAPSQSVLAEPISNAQSNVANKDQQSNNSTVNTSTTAAKDSDGPAFIPSLTVPYLRLDDILKPKVSSDSFLYYAVRFGPSHAISTDDLCGTASYLCHLQYLHMRITLNCNGGDLENQLLSLDYINAARQVNSKALGWAVTEQGTIALGNIRQASIHNTLSIDRAVSTTAATNHANSIWPVVPSYAWISPADAATGLITFQCFYQQEFGHWGATHSTHELVYQYALAFPDNTVVCRVARALVSWYLFWSGRQFGLVNWDNKPQALGALMAVLRGHGANVQYVSFSPDGLYLASASFDRTVRVWNVETGDLRLELKGHTYYVGAVVWSPDGTKIASGGYDNTIRLWDADTGEIVKILQGDDVWFHSLEFSPDGRKLCCGVSDWCVWIWDLATSEVESKLEGHKDKIHAVTYSPDGKLIASGSEDETIRLWSTTAGVLVHEIQAGHVKGVLSLAFDADGVRLVSAGMDGVVKLFSCEDFELLKEFKGHEKGVYSVRFHPDKIRIVSGSYDRKIRIWNSLNGQLLHTFHGHNEEVNGVAVSPNGTRIASCSADRTICLWDSNLEVTKTSLAQATSEGKGHIGSIYSVSYSPDGKRFLTCGEDKVIRLWDSLTGQLQFELKGHKEGVLASCFLPNGKRVVSGSTDSSIRFWSTATGKEIDLKVKDKTGFVWALVVSPDGSQLVSGSTDASLRVWDSESGALIRIIKGPKGMIYSVAYSPDGRRVACGSETKVVRIYDVESGDLKMELAGHQGDVHSVVFSPDGKYIASGSYDKSIRIWSADTGKLVHELLGHTNWVNSVAFSPNSLYLCSGGHDQCVRVWDVTSGRCLSALNGHVDAVLSVKFSPDGTQILSTGKHRDQTFRVWSFSQLIGGNINANFSSNSNPQQLLPPITGGSRPNSTNKTRVSGSPSASLRPLDVLSAQAAAQAPGVPVLIPIGQQMATQFDFRTDKGSLVAGCVQLSCHS